ncbi:MAG: GNAT family N-acetyltransferase [Gammaproteobacteria bacterium]
MTRPTLKIHAGVGDIPAEQWQALTGNDPFLSHAYLSALAASGCVTSETGWQPQYLALWQQDRLLGAMPLYLKHHSFGEFVFDWAWADAYQQHGLRYYPKLLCAIPFTPVTGNRLLTERDGRSTETRTLLINAALQLARQQKASSLHCLFLSDGDCVAMQRQGMIIREDVQFHWQNPGYDNFHQFLATLKHSKRKRIKQERRQVAGAGISCILLTGEQASPEDWAFFARCYAQTRRRYNAPLALNADFFQRLGRTLPQHTLLVVAKRNGRPIASALNIFTDEVLYGRSWGALEYHPGLHFETCYYQAMEFCIRSRIPLFEGGAQGEHKLARGFLPVRTRSAHWLAQPQFFRAIEDYIVRETNLVSGYVEALHRRSPFRET